MEKKGNSQLPNLLKWAKEMGYPGADKPEFKENLQKLNTSATRQMWTQFVKHVRPAGLVSHMNNQLLVYKRTVEGNPTRKILNKFDSLSDYEAALKKNKLETKLGRLALQQERTTAEIKISLQRLTKLDTQSQLEREADKKNMDQLRLLRLEKTELDKQIRTTYKAGKLLASSMAPFPIENVSRVSEPYRDQVSEFCQSLERGREVEAINQCLSSALDKPLSFNEKDLSSYSTDKRLDLLDMAQDLQKTCSKELKETENRKIEALEMLERKKEEIEKLSNSKKVEDPAQAILLRQMFASDGLRLFMAKESQNYLENWSIDNRSNFSSFDELSQASEMTEQISALFEEVWACVRFSANNLEDNVGPFISKIRSIANSGVDTSEIDSKVEMIASQQLRLIDDIIKTLFMTKKSHTKNIHDLICFETNYPKITMIKMMTNAEESSRHSNTLFSSVRGIISSAKSASNKAKQEMNQLLREIEEIVEAVENKSKEFNDYLEFWNQRLLVECSSSEPDYRRLLLKFKSNLEELSPRYRSDVLNKIWKGYFN